MFCKWSKSGHPQYNGDQIRFKTLVSTNLFTPIFSSIKAEEKIEISYTQKNKKISKKFET